MKRIKDLVVKTGSFKGRDGETKGVYTNIGSVIQADDGDQFLSIKRDWNPAGVPCDPSRDSIIVNMYDIRDRN